MSSLKIIVSLLLLVTSSKGSVVAPALAPAPVVAPAISYARAIPYNVSPFAASVNVFTRHLAAPVLHAAPLAAGLLPPVVVPAAVPALPAPALAGVIPQARSIHPPTLLHGSVLGAPALPAPLPHALAGPPAVPLPHALAGPALAAPLPHGPPLAEAPLGPLPYAYVPPVWRR